MYAKYFVSYRPPHKVIDEYGYKVNYMHQLMTTMSGSGEGHTVYFYERACPLGKSTTGCRTLTLPAKGNLPTAEVECDEVFYDAIRLAVGAVQTLKDHATDAFQKHVTSERPKRERKQPPIPWCPC